MLKILFYSRLLTLESAGRSWPTLSDLGTLGLVDVLLILTSVSSFLLAKKADSPGVRFSGRPVANGAQNWLRVTSIFDYSSPDGDSKYLRSCNILDLAKINGMSINIRSVVLDIC